MMRRLRWSAWVSVWAMCIAATTVDAQDVITPDVSAAGRGAGWTLSNRGAEAWSGDGRTGVRLDGRQGHGMAWLDGSDFDSGSIDVWVRGANTPGRSFVGVAFRGVDHETFDAVYLRPFNFRADNPVARSRAVQYISHPDNPWQVLREQHPGQYESDIVPAPDPDAFVHLRVELSGGVVAVYVNDAREPSLRVEELSGRTGGKVGLWVGNGSDGTFSDLVLRPSGSGRE